MQSAHSPASSPYWLWQRGQYDVSASSAFSGCANGSCFNDLSRILNAERCSARYHARQFAAGESLAGGAFLSRSKPCRRNSDRPAESWQNTATTVSGLKNESFSFEMRSAARIAAIGNSVIDTAWTHRSAPCGSSRRWTLMNSIDTIRPEIKSPASRYGHEPSGPITKNATGVITASQASGNTAKVERRREERR